MGLTKGKATYYPGKLQPPASNTFTRDTLDALAYLQQETSSSRGDLVEHAVRRMVGLPTHEGLESIVVGALARVASQK